MPTPRAEQRGFTLIEVLVALVVFVAAAMALDSTMGANIGGVARHEEKTLATWVASNKLVELQVYQRWPKPGTQDDEAAMGGRTWFVETEVSNGPFPDTLRVDVRVGLQPEGALQDKVPVSTLTGLLVRPVLGKGPAAGAGGGGGGAGTNDDGGGREGGGADDLPPAATDEAGGDE